MPNEGEGNAQNGNGVNMEIMEGFSEFLGGIDRQKVNETLISKLSNDDQELVAMLTMPEGYSERIVQFNIETILRNTGTVGALLADEFMGDRQNEINNRIKIKLRNEISRKVESLGSNRGNTVLKIAVLDLIKQNFNANPENMGRFIQHIGPIIQTLCTTRNRVEFKKCCHEIINLCEQNGLPFRYDNRTTQIFWTNTGLGKGRGLLHDVGYRKFFSDEDSRSFNGMLWELIPLLVSAASPKKNGTILEQYSKKCHDELEKRRIEMEREREEHDPREEDKAFKLPLFGILSEVWAERVQDEDLRNIRIEFGQNIRADEAVDRAMIAGDAAINPRNTMVQAELPILLAKAAKYNYDLERYNAINRNLDILRNEKAVILRTVVRKTLKESKRLRQIDKKISELERKLISVTRPDFENRQVERIDLTNAVSYERYNEGRNNEGGGRIPNGILKFKPTNHANNEQPVRNIEINISTLQQFIEAATREKQRMLTIKEVLETLKHGRGHDAGPLSNVITNNMIENASDDPIIASEITKLPPQPQQEQFQLAPAPQVQPQLPRQPRQQNANPGVGALQ